MRWFLDGEEIKDTDRYEIVVNGKFHKLVIKDTALTDAGTITACVDNDKSTAKLKVEGENQSNVCLHENIYHKFIHLLKIDNFTIFQSTFDLIQAANSFNAHLNFYLLNIYMKMYRDEKTQDLYRMILFVEIFANVKHFGF